MNWLMAEPARDIRAQILALVDPRHPKAAMFLAPGNAGDAPGVGHGLMRAERREGVLLTADLEKMRVFVAADMPDDASMAWILGYPEPKDAAIATSTSGWLRVVQACDWQGNVITEALCSPTWFARTMGVLSVHGASVRSLTVEQALERRFALRCAEAA
jgi:hypothetical protein